MYAFNVCLLLCLMLFSCSIDPKAFCTGKSKYGREYNKIRLQVGAPIIHNYMCLETPNATFEESWRMPKALQMKAKNGFHAGKTIFLQSEAQLDEKDIFRKRIDDTTFMMLGILTEVRNGKTEYPSIWFMTVDARDISLAEDNRAGREHKMGFTSKFTIHQADSVLQSWATARGQ